MLTLKANLHQQCERVGCELPEHLLATRDRQIGLREGLRLPPVFRPNPQEAKHHPMMRARCVRLRVDVAHTCLHMPLCQQRSAPNTSSSAASKRYGGELQGSAPNRYGGSGLVSNADANGINCAPGRRSMRSSSRRLCSAPGRLSLMRWVFISPPAPWPRRCGLRRRPRPAPLIIARVVQWWSSGLVDVSRLRAHIAASMCSSRRLLIGSMCSSFKAAPNIVIKRFPGMSVSKHRATSSTSSLVWPTALGISLSPRPTSCIATAPQLMLQEMMHSKCSTSVRLD